MEPQGYEAAGPSSSSRNGSYDRVVVRDAAGKTRQLSRSEFENLPLRERVAYLIGGTAEFFAGVVPVSPAEAMKG